MQQGSTFHASLMSPEHSSSAMEGFESMAGWRGGSYGSGSFGPTALGAFFLVSACLF